MRIHRPCPDYRGGIGRTFFRPDGSPINRDNHWRTRTHAMTPAKTAPPMRSAGTRSTRMTSAPIKSTRAPNSLPANEPLDMAPSRDLDDVQARAKPALAELDGVSVTLDSTASWPTSFKKRSPG